MNTGKIPEIDEKYLQNLIQKERKKKAEQQ